MHTENSMMILVRDESTEQMAALDDDGSASEHKCVTTGMLRSAITQVNPTSVPIMPTRTCARAA
jgi:hypothetical protein